MKIVRIVWQDIVGGLAWSNKEELLDYEDEVNPITTVGIYVGENTTHMVVALSSTADESYDSAMRIPKINIISFEELSLKE
jgi:hypothetical protein